jgi:hypothetical protein
MPEQCRGSDEGDDVSYPSRVNLLVELLDVLDRALTAATEANDVARSRQVLSARASIWYALADLADQIHPAYALACRSAASWEHHTADNLTSSRCWQTPT